MKRTGTRPKIVVTAGGRGVVGHAGTRLLADLADATGLSTAVSEALQSLRQPYVRSLREQGVQTCFSVGIAITEAIRTAISACVDWQPGIDTDSDLRDGAEIAEITHLLDLSAYPTGTRAIVRRERPHPGAQLSLFDTIEGLRHQVFITDTPRPACSVQLLELRHRGHARVEDRIRVVRRARRTYLRIAESWPWARELVTAYTCLAALPRRAL